MSSLMSLFVGHCTSVWKSVCNMIFIPDSSRQVVVEVLELKNHSKKIVIGLVTHIVT